MHEHEGEAFGLERLGNALAQRVAQQCHEHLCARIDAQALPAETQQRPLVQQVVRHEFAQHGLVDDEREARIAAGQRMTDLVILTGVAQKHLARVGHRHVVANVAHVGPAIRKHEVRRRDLLGRTAMRRLAGARHVGHAHERSLEQYRGVELRHGTPRDIQPKDTRAPDRLPRLDPAVVVGFCTTRHFHGNAEAVIPAEAGTTSEGRAEFP